MTISFLAGSSLEEAPALVPTKPARLFFLEGLRGLAAMYVVLSHCQQQAREVLSPAFLSGTRWMEQGHWAVDVFIVLSGYCLMLPVVRSEEGHLRGGVGAYFFRRARRIVPPYYAALLVSFLLLEAAHRLSKPGTDAGYKENFSAQVLLSHLLLVQNLSLHWIYAINPALWSVATEWQIYFVLPALLLPVWRRFGGAVAVLIGFGCGLLPHFLLPKAANFDWAYPWYLGLFALGMAGAGIGFSARRRDISLRRVPWGQFTLVLIAGIGVLTAFHVQLAKNAYVIDFLIGLLCMSAIIHSARYLTEDQSTFRPWLLRICEAKVSLRLGEFSYSLYLTHVPIIHFVYIALLSAHLGSELTFGLLILIGVPTALGAAYLFSLAFERPFSKDRRRQITSAEQAAAL